MSANNFKFENILVVIPDFNFYHTSDICDCEDKNEKGICSLQGNYDEFDDYAFKEYITALQAQLKKIGFDSCDRYNRDSSYSGIIISEYQIIDRNGDTYKTIEVVIRSGHYERANIDYTIIDESNKENKLFEKWIDSKIKKVEKILRANGTEYLKVGQFSNDEAVYTLKQ